MKRGIMRNFILGLSVLTIIVILASSPAHAVNIALSGTATANSEYFPAGYAIDGNFLTGWAAGDHGTPTDPNWLIVDLGNAFDVNQIVITAFLLDGLYSGYTNVYNLYTGLNVSNWTLQLSGTFIDESLVYTDRVATMNFPGSGLNMRYAKYEVVDGTHWSGATEIEIFDGTSPVPEPTTMLLLGLGLIGLAGVRRKLN